ncbi:hypothetical protein GGTG_11000 [Gaeumannomyces tritici R3-111a-1]|uniref:Uncharacterized protein n=1 Tax=Gaeumannomyces tritici (strain R3-111a-1) TaxID=644352 RepID=J3PBX6_GAET3|nr:hypothetical protein GGTG_11000 [Gaeumannomyces tritici R3-111a-1]EJT71746.1 hypothetical protein GGTG_11000 [Gaeumannomyces tritici R3-111a-1]
MSPRKDAAVAGVWKRGGGGGRRVSGHDGVMRKNREVEQAGRGFDGGRREGRPDKAGILGASAEGLKG